MISLGAFECVLTGDEILSIPLVESATGFKVDAGNQQIFFLEFSFDGFHRFDGSPIQSVCTDKREQCAKSCVVAKINMRAHLVAPRLIRIGLVFDNFQVHKSPRLTIHVEEVIVLVSVELDEPQVGLGPRDAVHAFCVGGTPALGRDLAVLFVIKGHIPHAILGAVFDDGAIKLDAMCIGCSGGSAVQDRVARVTLRLSHFQPEVLRIRNGDVVEGEERCEFGFIQHLACACMAGAKKEN